MLPTTTCLVRLDLSFPDIYDGGKLELTFRATDDDMMTLRYFEQTKVSAESSGLCRQHRSQSREWGGINKANASRKLYGEGATHTGGAKRRG